MEEGWDGELRCKCIAVDPEGRGLSDCTAYVLLWVGFGIPRKVGGLAEERKRENAG